MRGVVSLLLAVSGPVLAAVPAEAVAHLDGFADALAIASVFLVCFVALRALQWMRAAITRGPGGLGSGGDFKSNPHDDPF